MSKSAAMDAARCSSERNALWNRYSNTFAPSYIHYYRVRLLRLDGEDLARELDIAVEWDACTAAYYSGNREQARRHAVNITHLINQRSARATWALRT